MQRFAVQGNRHKGAGMNKRWSVDSGVELTVLKHDRKLAIVIPNNLSPSWVRRLFAEAANLYEQANPYPTPGSGSGPQKGST